MAFLAGCGYSEEPTDEARDLQDCHFSDMDVGYPTSANGQDALEGALDSETLASFRYKPVNN